MNRNLKARSRRHEQGFRFALAALVVLLVHLSFGPALAQVSSGGDSDKTATANDAVEVAMVRHAPVIAGSVNGSVRMLLPENVTIAGSTVVTGDLKVPGTPRVRMTGRAVYAGTVDQGGPMQPTNHLVTLGGQARLGHVMRCIDQLQMASIDAPSAPQGTESITLSQPDQCIRHWETVRDLTLTGQALACPVPAGDYGAFRADAGTGFILGVAGSTIPSHYSFESLALGSHSSFQVVGPVVVTVTSGPTLGGSVGNASYPSWLKLQICSGDLTLNAGSTLNALVLAPRSTVFVNTNAMLVGFVSTDRLWVGSGGVISGAGDGPDPQGPTEIFSYQSLWRYKIFANPDEVPEGWEEADFKATGWVSGRGAFASGGYCDLQVMRQTDWPVNTDIVIRKNFRLPNGVTSLRISGTVDNEVQIFLNGRLITDWVQHDGCAQPDDISFTAPANSYWAGMNTIAIRARDAGDQSFIDYRVTINE